MPKKSARCPNAWGMSPSPTTTRDAVKNSSFRPPKPFGIARGAAPNASTRTCTTTTADVTSGSAQRGVKVAAHLSFGLLVIAAEQLLKLLA